MGCMEIGSRENIKEGVKENRDLEMKFDESGKNPSKCFHVKRRKGEVSPLFKGLSLAIQFRRGHFCHENWVPPLFFSRGIASYFYMPNFGAFPFLRLCLFCSKIYRASKSLSNTSNFITSTHFREIEV